MPYTGTVAVVGIGGIFPDAPELESFWENIRSGRSATREVPDDRWSVPAGELYSPQVGALDHVYSRRGCFIQELPPLSALAGLAMDPALLDGMDPLFHLLVHAGKRAFDDGVTEQLDRSRVGVIIGNLALPSESSALLTRQTLGRTFAEKLLGRPVDYGAANPLNRYVAGLPAGILAQALGLGGGSFTLDAACASSLYAIKLAMDELLSGRSDAMLSGGLSRPDPLYTQMGFSQLRALSKRGICSPFDAAGDGLVVGEGAGLFLLKRTDDALAHGDRIYGVIRGIGLANDVGGSLLAPLSEGQLRAMRAAYEQAGWSPWDVELIECHATGTPVGDAVEVASLKELWGKEFPPERSSILGSVKSNIGHLLTAAGAAALTKVLLAMGRETLPPTAGFHNAQPGMALEQTPFRVLTREEPWLRRGEGIPRRAAVSAFGFGGINAHLLVEEWIDAGGKDCSPKTVSMPCAPTITPFEPIAVVGMDACFGPWQSLRSFQERVLGGRTGDLPTLPRRWWGARESSKFGEEGVKGTSFAGFYLDEVAVAAEQFRIPPKELEEMLPQQLLMLRTAAGAMADAGIHREGNLRTGLFIGIALDLNSSNYSYRWSLAGETPSWAAELGLHPTPLELAEWTALLRDVAAPPLTANRTMGGLGSVVASRIAREFKVGGPSFTLSSEESSGVRSLAIAVSLLRNGEIDRALVGGVDFAGDPRAVLGHHAGRPFSPKGTALPLSTQADGSIVGEGAGAVVLKRLTDAQRDGDRIYAVIRGIGAATGGTVIPDETAYTLALERAYAQAGVSPHTVSYIEAHAPGHPASDRMEATALASFFGTKDSPPRYCAVSSLAGEIGHTGAAAGLASLIRGCLALHQEIIPPCRGAATPLPALSGNSPLFLPATPRYWLRNRVEGPRRAGVSVFGVDGSYGHLVLEGWELNHPQEGDCLFPAGSGEDALFVITGESPAELSGELELLRRELCGAGSLGGIAFQWHKRSQENSVKAAASPALSLVARTLEELTVLLDLGEAALASGEVPALHPTLRDRLFYTTTPLGPMGKVAFVFPGSGNHYPGMGAELSARWPEIYRRQDRQNRFLRGQFKPELFWNGAPQNLLDADTRAVIFGQVAVGCAVSDLIRNFGIAPQAVIGYSLGESAGLLALAAWQDRDGMRERMEESTLFTRDLAGEYRAARRAWGIPEGEGITWSIGVVEATAARVRAALHLLPRVYLLIINTPDECVVGGDAGGVNELVAALGCRFFPLSGITTVHCQVAREVAESYRALHLFPTTPPEGITFYSGAWGRAYLPDRELAADAILAQALEGIDYPAVIHAAYNDGVRLFLEMGPGSSCSRMINEILDGSPHLARPVVTPGQEPVSATLRFLAQLASERIPLELSSLYEEPPVTVVSSSHHLIRVTPGGAPYLLPLLPQRTFGGAIPLPDLFPHGITPGRVKERVVAGRPNAEHSLDSVIRGFAAAQGARVEAHAAYLRSAQGLTLAMAEALALQASLVAALGGEQFPPHPTSSPPFPQGDGTKSNVAYDREACLEFARGSVARVLGPEFALADTFPTRVRLPDEPLMLVDRIVSLEGDALSMTSGRVVTEHDIHPDAWYLDGGRIPTCIAVEAGQADLFLSGYLGIDFITRGMAVYRLLDAVVTFHRGLPEPGEVINYDIRIERFFRQGETHLFRFFFEATVNGEPLLSMKDGCAGFFTAGELAAGKGIVRPLLELRPENCTLPDDWRELAPMAREQYDALQVDRLRIGDLAGCFGDSFAALSLAHPLTIPGGKMRLVHRVMELDPAGGRYGLGLIRAEADIHPDDWFITSHFVDDRVMPGTLMYECCLQTLRIFLLRMGWVAESPGAAWEPVPGVASRLCCRGQVLETTKIVTYQVTIRRLGYRPEPYAVVDALMYADGKPIVEITSMSVRLTGTTKEKLVALWSRTEQHAPPALPLDLFKPAVYTKEQIRAYSNGDPSEGFGEPYRIFDQARKIARLPGPPFQFMDRITAVSGEPWRMKEGARVEAQYLIPTDAWYFAADRQPRIPFAILLEAALQPCGWLAAYVGSALTNPTDLAFRNLGGSAILHRPVTPATGVITAVATLTKAATSGGMIIQEFSFNVADREGTLYQGETMFGFFSREALANQVGIRDAKPYQPTQAETDRGRSCPFPTDLPFPDRQLRMMDQVELFVPDGGPAGFGYIRGTKEVDPNEWFFKAHFYQDPVTPGSLGLESFLQLLKFVAVERWGWRQGELLVAAVPGRRHRWLYRGQVVPTNSRVRVEAWITGVDEQNRILTADGFLSVDGKLIYQMNDFTLKMDGQR